MVSAAFMMVVWAIGVLISLVYYQILVEQSEWYATRYRLTGKSDKQLHWCNALSWGMFAWMMLIMSLEGKTDKLKRI